jgi:hypothetical protein
MVDTPKHFDVDALRKAASSVPDEEKSGYSTMSGSGT